MSILTILFLLLVYTAAESQRRPSNITIGSSLTPNFTWSSPSGVYSFGFFPQHVNSYAVGIFLPDKTVVWTANRDTNPTVPDDVVSLLLSHEGRLVLRRRQGQDVDVISLRATIAFASMHDNGNFVLYDSYSRVIWQSFDHPTNTLLPGQRIRAVTELLSSASETDYGRGIFRLKMQQDGNLVQYPINTPDTRPYAYFATDTDRVGSNVSLNLDSDGRLYLLNGSLPLKNKNISTGRLPTQGYINFMRLDVGGIFRIYSLSLSDHTLARSWSSTTDECVPKGLCGVNAYCTIMGSAPTCQCLPGFVSVQSGNNTAPCYRNFTAKGCPQIDGRLKSEMLRVDITEWDDTWYESTVMSGEEECSKACLDDCNCEAAMYAFNQCRKQRLPIRYSRWFSGSRNVAFVRITTNTVPDSGGDSDHIIIIKKERRIGNLIIGIVLMSVGALALSMSLIFVHRKRKDYMKISKEDGASFVEGISLQVFTFKHLSEATNGFKEEVGRGASGTVFKGVMHNGRKKVAVKRLDKEFAQGEREFQTELKTIGKMYHRNLVRLLGYCFDGGNRLLVFEYMSNGSLADILFNQEKRLSWEERMEIARDISRGILYLHQECETQIIHCDIKPENILMDDNWRAKISDFGVAKLLKQDQTNTYTGIRGTKGYVAPEWYQKQAITVKADVYSFGVMLLEIICCRKCVDSSGSEDEAILEEWVFECYATRKIGSLVRDEMVEERKVERMVKIGIWCVQYDPSLRPTMKKVLLMMEGTVEIPIPPRPTSFLSSI